MKRTFITLALALAALVSSCKKEEAAPVAKGVNLTLSATVASEADATKTTYEYAASGIGMAGTIATSWEATEKITVISIGDSGITAVDEFTSTGEAGRAKAEFSGTWNGNEGDKVICLYPASSEAGALFSGVTAGSASIILNSPANAYDVAVNIGNSPNSLKSADVMVGEVSISGSAASVNLSRQISVFKVTVSTPSIDPYYPTYEYLKRISLSATDPTGTAAVFATSGSLAVTKSTYTGSFVPASFGTMTFGCDIRSDSTNDSFTYFYPVFAKDELDSGYAINVTGNSTSKKEDYSSYSKRFEIGERLHIYPGYVYELKNISF